MTYRRGSEAEADELPGGFVKFGEPLSRFRLRTEAAVMLRPFCESPIEVILGAELWAEFDFHVCLQDEEPLSTDRHLLIPQYKFGRYRADFAVRPPGTRYLFIECDGAEFHSSEAQKKRDRAKDAVAARAGIPVLRFAGAEIHRDPRRCALIIVAWMEQLR